MSTAEWVAIVSGIGAITAFIGWHNESRNPAQDRKRLLLLSLAATALCLTASGSSIAVVLGG